MEGMDKHRGSVVFQFWKIWVPRASEFLLHDQSITWLLSESSKSTFHVCPALVDRRPLIISSLGLSQYRMLREMLLAAVQGRSVRGRSPNEALPWLHSQSRQVLRDTATSAWLGSNFPKVLLTWKPEPQGHPLMLVPLFPPQAHK